MEKKFAKIEGFDWDEGNTRKNREKHNVLWSECEEAFFDPKRKSMKDLIHSQKETRYILLGETSSERLLYMVFTIRKNRIRIISARDINKKERFLYEEKS